MGGYICLDICIGEIYGGNVIIKQRVSKDVE